MRKRLGSHVDTKHSSLDYIHSYATNCLSNGGGAACSYDDEEAAWVSCPAMEVARACRGASKLNAFW